MRHPRQASRHDPFHESEPARYRPAFHVRYSVDGHNYDAEDVYDVTNLDSTDKAAAEAVLERFDLGQEYPCWYDPIDHAARCVLVRGYSGWLYLTLLIPLSFIIIGGGRLIYTLLHWNASAERRASRSAKRANRSVRRRIGQNQISPRAGRRQFDQQPRHDARLSPAAGHDDRLGAVRRGRRLRAVEQHRDDLRRDGHQRFRRGQPDWTLAGLVVPVLAVGVFLIVRLARQILMATGVGPTLVEISAHPLGPGEPYDVFLSQSGRVAIRRSSCGWPATSCHLSARNGHPHRNAPCLRGALLRPREFRNPSRAPVREPLPGLRPSHAPCTRFSRTTTK